MLNKVLFLIVLFISNIIQTITGFAGNMLAMPPSLLLLGYDSSKTVLNIFTMTACGIIAFKNRQYIKWEILLKMCLYMLLGMFAGIRLVSLFNLGFLLYAYGAMIIVIALKKLFVKKEIKFPSVLMPLALLGAGIIHGMFVSGGALLVVYAAWALPEKNSFRATVAPVWVFLGIILAAAHIIEGLYTKENIILIVISIIPLILSIKIGNILYNKINRKAFLNITYILLVLAGIMIFI